MSRTSQQSLNNFDSYLKKNELNQKIYKLFKKKCGDQSEEGSQIALDLLKSDPQLNFGMALAYSLERLDKWNG